MGEVVVTMPKGEGNQVKVVFFNVGSWISYTDSQREYELRGLKPADPYSLCAVNQAYPDFANETPNATQWQDVSGNWCFAQFFKWPDGRIVVVGRYNEQGHGWGGDWWLAGIRT